MAKKKPARSGKQATQAREPRADGENTRQQILETAGELFAQYGYDGTTCKMICEQSGSNAAAVNYHFGSRDGLYSALLVESHRRLITLSTLQAVTGSALSPKEKLERLLDLLLDGMEARQWHARLFIREIIAPSPLIEAMITEEAMPKLALVRGLLAQITGLKPDDPVLTRCLLSTIAPCAFLLLVNRDNLVRVVGDVWQDKLALKSHLIRFLFAGLDQVTKATDKANSRRRNSS